MKHMRLLGLILVLAVLGVSEFHGLGSSGCKGNARPVL